MEGRRIAKGREPKRVLTMEMEVWIWVRSMAVSMRVLRSVLGKLEKEVGKS